MYAAAAAAASNPAYAIQGTTAGAAGLIPMAPTQNMLPATAATAAGAPSTGNPLLDAYSQYAALAAAGVVTTGAATGTIDAQTSKSGLMCFLIKRSLATVVALRPCCAHVT